MDKSVFNRVVKFAVHPLFNGPEGLSPASHNAKLCAKNFSKNSSVDDSGIPYLLSLAELV